MMNVRQHYEGPGGVQGNVLTSGDQVALRMLGINWSSFQFSVVAAGTATVKAEYTTESGPIDGVKNWLPAPLAHRTSVANGNPTLAQIKATTLSLGDVWVMEIPGNCQAVRIACDGTGTVSTVLLQPDKPWLPGVPVAAVLADVTESGIGVGIASTIFDFTGWQSMTVYISSPTGQVFTVRPVDDTGTAMSNLSQVGTAASASTISFVRGGAHTTLPTTLIAGAWTAGTLDEKRFSVALPAGGSVSAGRYRITAYR